MGRPSDADTDDDGRVSMAEAFDYARSMDTTQETPYYEDSGDGSASGACPGRGRGGSGERDLAGMTATVWSRA